MKAKENKAILKDGTKAVEVAIFGKAEKLAIPGREHHGVKKYVWHDAEEAQRAEDELLNRIVAGKGR